RVSLPAPAQRSESPALRQVPAEVIDHFTRVVLDPIDERGLAPAQHGQPQRVQGDADDRAVQADLLLHEVSSAATGQLIGGDGHATHELKSRPTGMGLELLPAAKILLSERGYDPVLGARPLRRTIQRDIEDNLGRAGSLAGPASLAARPDVVHQPQAPGCRRVRARLSELDARPADRAPAPPAAHPAWAGGPSPDPGCLATSGLGTPADLAVETDGDFQVPEWALQVCCSNISGPDLCALANGRGDSCVWTKARANGTFVPWAGCGSSRNMMTCTEFPNAQVLIARIPFDPGSQAMTRPILVADRVPTSDVQLTRWVDETAELTKPDHIMWCDGSDSEWESLTDLLVEQGTFTRLNPQIRPNSFHCASDPSDVARVEDRTFICSVKQEDAGPTNNWIAPDEMRKTLADLFNGCMRGRTMYVVPFCMGPLGSNLSQFGVEITD